MCKHRRQPAPPVEPNGPRDPGRRDALKRLVALGALAAVAPGVLQGCAGRWAAPAGKAQGVIVLGLDGLDARLIERGMAEGKLPNLSRLRGLGGYRRIISTVPPQSPVAWASIITGRNPGAHGIFDFIARDPKTRLPHLSIARTEAAGRRLSLGDWRVPLAGAKVECLREGPTFWDVLCARDVPCSVYHVPTDFPPRTTGANELAGLGAPDLRGTYGEFSYYTDDPPPGARAVTGGAVYLVTISNGHARARLTGPDNTLRKGQPPTAVDFDIWIDRAHRLAKIDVQGREVILRQGEWSDWVPVSFEMAPHLKYVNGICLFYLKEASPHFKLYVSPVNVDPADPALPIASPSGFGRDLAERFGRFYTMGFPEDVKALRHDLLSDDEYLHQTGITVTEARRMYEHALSNPVSGLLFSYFSFTDRTQHMFWRAIDPGHPAYTPELARTHGKTIEDCYREADGLVGRTLEAAGTGATVLVLSDHGFETFRRAFSLNTWLAQHGYLAGIEPWRGDTDIFSNADWTNSGAYGIGFNALYLNLQGREEGGSVAPEDREPLLRRLVRELQEVRDPATGARVIAHVYPAAEVYPGTHLARMPDLIVGYAEGYRCSDDSVLGSVPKEVVQDNTDKWSGDHCVDRGLVPGVLFASKPLKAGVLSLEHVAASVLAEFGLAAPAGMTQETIW